MTKKTTLALNKPKIQILTKPENSSPEKTNFFERKKVFWFKLLGTLTTYKIYSGQAFEILQCLWGHFPTKKTLIILDLLTFE